jgi:hypothetical protein
MSPPDIKADAQRVFKVLQAGGIAIVPASMGYTIMTSNDDALERIFLAKGRPAYKRHAMGGSFALHQSVHDLRGQNADIIRWLVQEFDLPLGVIAPYRADHPIFKNIEPRTMEAASVGGTLAMLINAGQIMDEVSKLTLAASIPWLGSSANISGTGMMFHSSSPATKMAHSS